MHTVDHPAIDGLHKLPIGIAQVRQHIVVDVIKWEVRFQISPHHAAGYALSQNIDGLVAQLALQLPAVQRRRRKKFFVRPVWSGRTRKAGCFVCGDIPAGHKAGLLVNQCALQIFHGHGQCFLDPVLEQKYGHQLSNKNQRVNLLLCPQAADLAVVEAYKAMEYAFLPYGKLQGGEHTPVFHVQAVLFVQPGDILAVKETVIAKIIAVVLPGPAVRQVLQGLRLG